MTGLSKKLERRGGYVGVYTALFVIFAFLFFIYYLVVGKSLLCWFDGEDQHYLCFTYFGLWVRNIFKTLAAGGGLQLPAWETSLGYGADAITTWTAGFGEPLSLISVFTPTRYAEMAYDAVIVLRHYFAGLAFTLYARSRGVSGFSTLAGSLFYAFSGWMLLSFTESPLVAPAVYFPLMCLGADKVLEGKSPILFIVTTAAMFILYFYFGYMVCIAMPVYVVVRILFPSDGVRLRDRTQAFFIDAAKRTGKAALCFVCGVLVSAFVVMPVYEVMITTGRLGVEHYSPLRYQLSYYPMLLSSFFNSAILGPDSIFGCAALCVPCIPLLVMRRKDHRALFILFFLGLFCLLVPMMGRVFNGMGYVANRWLWIYELCVAMVFARMVEGFRTLNLRELRITVAFLAVCGLLCLVFPNARTAGVFVGFGIAMLFLMASAMSRHPTGGLFGPLGLQVATLGLLAYSVAMPAYYVAYGASKNANEYDTVYRRIFESPLAQGLDLVKDDGLYRYQSAGYWIVRNSDLLIHRNSYNFYMSIYNGHLEQFEEDLELASTSFPQQLSGPGGSAYLNTALANKYFIAPTWYEPQLPQPFSHEPVVTYDSIEGEYSVYKSELALPFAYTFDHAMSQEAWDALPPERKRQALLQVVALEDAEASAEEAGVSFNEVVPPLTVVEMSDRIQVTDDGVIVLPRKDEDATDEELAYITYSFEGVPQAELYAELANIRFEDMPVPALKEGATLPELLAHVEEVYWYKPRTECKVFFAFPDGSEEQFNVLNYRDHMYGAKNSHMLYFGYHEEPLDTVTIKFRDPGIYHFDSVRVVQQPLDDIERLVSERRADPVTVTEGVNSYTAEVDASGERYLFFAVPWTKGWRASLDGEEAEVLRANGAFMAMRVPTGHHTVTLEYHRPGFALGIVLSLVGVVGTILIAVWTKRHAEKGEEEQGSGDEPTELDEH